MCFTLAAASPRALARPRPARRIAALLATSFALTAGAHAADVVIGQTLPLSGPWAHQAAQWRLGAGIHLAHVNATGGVNGSSLRHVVLDDAGDPARAAANVQSLTDREQAVGLVGLASHDTVDALLRRRVLQDAGLSLVGAIGGGPQAGHDHDLHVYRVRAGFDTEAKQLAAYLSTLGVRTVALVYQDDGTGRAGHAAMVQALSSHGVELLGALALPTTLRSLGPEARQVLLARAPQAIVLAVAGRPAAEFVRAYRGAGGKAHLLSLSLADHAEVTRIAGIQAARGMGFVQVMPFPFNTAHPLVREYQQVLYRYGPMDATPSYAGLEGYVSARLLIEALRRAGPSPDASRVSRALEALGSLELGGMQVQTHRGAARGTQRVDITVLDSNGQLLR